MSNSKLNEETVNKGVEFLIKFAKNDATSAKPFLTYGEFLGALGLTFKVSLAVFFLRIDADN